MHKPRLFSSLLVIVTCTAAFSIVLANSAAGEDKKPVVKRAIKAPLSLKVNQAKRPGETPDTVKAADSGPAPQITVDNPKYDFGTIAQGEYAKHVFTIKNTGKGVLKVERARGG